MKTKLLKKLRKRAFIERRNSEYRGIFKEPRFGVVYYSFWLKTEKEAKAFLRYQILSYANQEFKRCKT